MTAENAIERVVPTTPEPVAGAPAPRDGWTYRPPADVVDAPDALELVVDLPGASAEHLDVTVESGVLTVDAPVAPRPASATRVLLREYGVGGYHRRFRLGREVDVDGMTATYRDGVLTVRLPKTAAARRHRVPIT